MGSQRVGHNWATFKEGRSLTKTGPRTERSTSSHLSGTSQILGSPHARKCLRLRQTGKAALFQSLEWTWTLRWEFKVPPAKKLYKLPYLQNRNRFIDLENEFMVTSGEGWERRIDWEFRIDMYTLLYFKWITNKDLRYSTWNSAQCYVAAWMRGEFGGEWIRECVAESLQHSPETITTLLISYIPM